MFPEKLAGDHILSGPNPGDIVLDPMCGAGAAGKMAKRRRRWYIGIDRSARSAALARERMASVAMSRMEM